MKEELNDHRWGGSGIEKVLFEFILKEFKESSTVIELGAGYCSTKAFSLYYNLYSIDENRNYTNIYPNVNYLHAPLNNSWYDKELVKNFIPKDYSLVFVDGPSGSGNRNGLIENINIFNVNASFIFHDTYREPEKNLAIEIAKILNKEIEFYSDGDYWGYIR